MRKRLQLLILFLIIQTLPALAQNIQGRVSDNMGESVAGAGVVNTGSGAYSITDAEGFYSLKASEGDPYRVLRAGDRLARRPGHHRVVFRGKRRLQGDVNLF